MKMVLITNDENYATLLLGHLNALNLWFDCKVLDLHVHLYKAKHLFMLIFHMLIRSKSNLRRTMVSMRTPVICLE